MSPKKRVLVIDDSAFVRQFLKETLNKSPELTVTAAVTDPIKAMELLKVQEFDVITLDIEMPKMDGLAFLQYVMRFNPLPVVVISSWTQENSVIAMKALSLGAIDTVAKPIIGYTEGLELLAEEIVMKVKNAANAKVAKTALTNLKTPTQKIEKTKQTEITDRIIAIGASTGGTAAISKIFRDLSPDLPGILVIQHMPEMFTGVFAKSLDQLGPVQVKEAEDGVAIFKGTALVVPGAKNIVISKNGNQYIVKIIPKLLNSVYNPSVNYTLESVAVHAGANALGIILTGMGDDGAKGLRMMYDAGAYTIAQDEKSSVIFGMPQKAIEYGGVHKIIPLEEIAREINNWGLACT